MNDIISVRTNIYETRRSIKSDMIDPLDIWFGFASAKIHFKNKSPDLIHSLQLISRTYPTFAFFVGIHFEPLLGPLILVAAVRPPAGIRFEAALSSERAALNRGECPIRRRDGTYAEIPKSKDPAIPTSTHAVQSPRKSLKENRYCSYDVITAQNLTKSFLLQAPFYGSQ